MNRFLLVLAFLASATSALSADLSSAQLVALKADINANFLNEWNAQQLDVILSAYNAPASPTFVVWKTTLPPSDYRDAIVWTELTARSAGERDMFAFLTGGGSMPLACLKLNVRQAVADAFSGAGGLATRTALVALCKRSITRFERLYASGTGSDATPGQATVEGDISQSDIIAAMGQ